MEKFKEIRESKATSGVLIGLNAFVVMAYLLVLFMPALIVKSGGNAYNLINNVYGVVINIMIVLVIATLVLNIVFFRNKNRTRAIVTTAVSIPMAIYILVFLGFSSGIIAPPVPM